MVRLLTLLAVVLWSATAVADGAITPNGAFYGSSDAHSSSVDFELDVGTKLIMDADAEQDDYIVVNPNGTMSFYSSAAKQGLFTSNVFQLLSNRRLILGSLSSYWHIYNSAGTQYELWTTDGDGGGTDAKVLYVVDGSTALYLENGEFIHNTSDGTITLGGTGGTNNEDLTLDFESIANVITYGSNTGATTHRFLGNITTIYSMTAAATGYYQFAGRTKLGATADGQLLAANAALSSGVVLDIDDVADTVVIKNQAGTGIGSLYVGGASQRGHIVIDCDDDPYTVPSTAHFVTVETGVGTCTGNMDVTLPAVACTPQTAQDDCRVLNVMRIGAIQVDIGGDGGTETINGSTSHSLTSSYQSVSLLETNSTSTDWVIW